MTMSAERYNLTDLEAVMALVDATSGPLALCIETTPAGERRLAIADSTPLDDPGLESDYRIGPTSPAAGAGQPSAWSWGDLSGACYAATPSIGAYQ